LEEQVWKATSQEEGKLRRKLSRNKGADTFCLYTPQNAKIWQEDDEEKTQVM
jgi:hypothetical protein